MESNEAFEIADRVVFETQGIHLSDLQSIIFLGSWEGLTYEEIALRSGYDHGYICQEGAKLWALLSKALGKDVSKTNFKVALGRRRNDQLIDPVPDPNFLSSEFYIERPDIESICFKAIERPGSFLRIKAPQQMGKSRLLCKILKYAKEQKGYKTLTLSFEEADSNVLTNISQFYKWFCSAVGKRLELAEELDHYWSDNCGYTFNTGIYFQEYLLREISRPLVLALTKVDLVFEHSEINKDFCQMLRVWHDHAARGESYSEVWQRLRLIIVHDTDIYASLNVNHSPITGIGIVVDLPAFTDSQIQELLLLRGAAWDDVEIKTLMDLVGGHPYLVSLALIEVLDKGVTLNELLQTAHTEAGIYSNHLRAHLATLRLNPELQNAFREVVKSDEPVKLEPEQSFKLQSMGLVKLDGDYAKPYCNLYRIYFRNHLGN